MRTMTDKLPVVSRREAAPPPVPWYRRPAVLPWAWATGLCLLYATVAVRRHQLLRTTGYDLGIFEQAVRAYAELRAPVVPLRGPGFHLLGDHFHPLLAALAPFYRLWPSPLCLLVAQSALLALAVVPLARWARRALGTRAAHVVAAGYGLSWGVASAAAFDFHEVALAVPLLAFALEALGRRRWGAAVAWAAPLLLVKEDLGLTLAAVGVYIAVKGPRRLGTATAAVGLLGSLIEVKLLLPAFNPGGAYAHGGHLADGHGSLLSTLAHAPLDALRPDIKAMTLILVFAPSALLALRSPLSLLAVPTLAWRMFSENPFHWGTAYHYSAILMPVVFAGLIDVLGRERQAPESPTRSASPACAGSAGAASPGASPVTAPAPGASPARAGSASARADKASPAGTAIATATATGTDTGGASARNVRASLATVLAVTVVLIPSFPLAQLAQRPTWRTTPHVEAARSLLARIPDGATVAASNRLAPQLTSRCEVVIFPTFPVDTRLDLRETGPLPAPTAEWIVYDAVPPEAWPQRSGPWPYPKEQQERELRAARESHGYEIVAARDGVTLLRRTL
ncbi:DUF2079 domain-containing protein [Streptomyces sp. NPDC057271]|uniref:DUF2079 domain-containing protein n=1 Tax=unclassified Streptomyces TaxID=2593676 RepID=UPI003643B4EE